jgi:two-component system, NtrC family, nitrogen regulation sensor histidine kinase NtrY
MHADLDATMIGQALTNLMKNAGEAIESLHERGAPDGHEPRVEVRLSQRGETALRSPSPTTASACPRTARGSSSLT